MIDFLKGTKVIVTLVGSSLAPGFCVAVGEAAECLKLSHIKGIVAV